MQVAEAVELLEDAVATSGGTTWTDFGAGDGTFTLALARILPSANILAVDRDRGALRELEQRAAADGSADRITTVVADFTRQFELPAVKTGSLDGMLLANSLHFVRNAGDVLAHLVRLLRPGGRAVFVEYDRRRANQWVPYPIDASKLPALCETAGLAAPVKTNTRPSDYGGDLYVAFARLPFRPSPSR